jgi:hypothetical protein
MAMPYLEYHAIFQMEKQEKENYCNGTYNFTHCKESMPQLRQLVTSLL